MISFIKTWTNQIIIAIIIATILEMILPNGNNKKYVRMIIGIYVLFTIIQPVIQKVSGDNLNIGFDYNKYFNNVVETYSQYDDFENSNSKLVTTSYINSIKDDITLKLSKKGYGVNTIDIKVEEKESSEKYGNIKSINMDVSKEDKKLEENNTDTTINKVDNVNIEINNKINNKSSDEDITDKEIKELKSCLAEEYSINENIIQINKRGD